MKLIEVKIMKARIFKFPRALILARNLPRSAPNETENDEERPKSQQEHQEQPKNGARGARGVNTHKCVLQCES